MTGDKINEYVAGEYTLTYTVNNDPHRQYRAVRYGICETPTVNFTSRTKGHRDIWTYVRTLEPSPSED